LGGALDDTHRSCARSISNAFLFPIFFSLVGRLFTCVQFGREDQRGFY
jgi:hypothetical protein